MSRTWTGSIAQTHPARFCQSPCLSVSAQIPDAQVRRQCLITAGLIRARAVRRSIALQRMPHLGVEIMPTTKFSNWCCPLCEYALPDKINNPAYVTRQHLLAHGSSGKKLLIEARNSVDIGTFATKFLEKRVATQREDTREKIRVVCALTPSWSCKYELTNHASVAPREGLRTAICYTCTACGKQTSNAYRALRCGAICEKAPDAAKLEADSLTPVARSELVSSCVLEGVNQDAERRAARLRQKQAVLATARRSRLL